MDILFLTKVPKYFSRVRGVFLTSGIGMIRHLYGKKNPLSYNLNCIKKWTKMDHRVK